MIKCYLCDIFLYDKKQYFAHLKMHSLEGICTLPAYCLECNNRSFSSLKDLGKHVSRFHLRNEVNQLNIIQAETVRDVRMECENFVEIEESSDVDFGVSSDIDEVTDNSFDILKIITDLINDQMFEDINTEISVCVLLFKAESRLSQTLLNRFIKEFSKIYKYILKLKFKIEILLIQLTNFLNSNLII